MRLIFQKPVYVELKKKIKNSLHLTIKGCALSHEKIYKLLFLLSVGQIPSRLLQYYYHIFIAPQIIYLRLKNKAVTLQLCVEADKELSSIHIYCY